MALLSPGVRQWGTSKPNTPVIQPQGSISKAYDAAAQTQAANYDDIYKNYDDILKSSKSNAASQKLNYVPINPVFTRNIQGTPYQRSSELNTALTGLEDYSRTGGYSDSDVNNIRERAISPIRAIYSNAQRGLDRQKVLSGGYAPNMGAITAKMARESAGQIGDITTKVNAEIAQMIANGKLNALSTLGSVSGRENEVSNQFNLRNTELANEVERMNAEEEARVNALNSENIFRTEELNSRNSNQNTNNQLNAVQGKASIYGTTPALTQTFGNQVLQNNQQNLQAVQTANAIKNQRAGIGLNIVGAAQAGSKWGVNKG